MQGGFTHKQGNKKQFTLCKMYNSTMTNIQSRTNHQYDQYLDAKNLNCPLPVLKAKLILNKMTPGHILFVEATDPHSKIDFEAYCARTGHNILTIREINKVFEFYIQCAENLANT